MEERRAVGSPQVAVAVEPAQRGVVHPKADSRSPARRAVLHRSPQAGARSARSGKVLHLPAARLEVGRERRYTGLRSMGVGIPTEEAGHSFAGEGFLSDSGLSFGGECLLHF